MPLEMNSQFLATTAPTACLPLASGDGTADDRTGVRKKKGGTMEKIDTFETDTSETAPCIPCG